MFLLVSDRHSDRHQHGVSIKIPINFGKQFLPISCVRNIAVTWILARVFAYLPSFFSSFWTLSIELFWFLFWFILDDVTLNTSNAVIRCPNDVAANFAYNFAYNLSLCASWYLFLRHAVMRRQFQSDHCIHCNSLKEERIGRFEGLPQFKWNDLGEQDVIGQGSFWAVFIAKTRNKDGRAKQWLSRNHSLLKITA